MNYNEKEFATRANKKAMTTASMTAQEIAEELLNLIPKDET